MIDAIDGYEYVLMDGWFGGLVYVYNADAIEVFNAYEIYTPRRFGIVSPVAVGAPLPLKANRFTRLTTTLNAAGTGPSTGRIPTMKKRGVTRLRIAQRIHPARTAQERVIVLGDLNDLIRATTNNVFAPFLDLPNEYVFADMDIAEGPSSGWSFPGCPSHLDLASLQ